MHRGHRCMMQNCAASFCAYVLRTLIAYNTSHGRETWENLRHDILFTETHKFLHIEPTMHIISQVVLLLVFIKLCQWLCTRIGNYRRLLEVVNRMPGPRYLPLVGNALQIRGHPDDFFAQLVGCCSMFTSPLRMCRIWLFTDPYVILYGAKEVESVFMNPHLIDKSDSYNFLHTWLGLGLLTAPGTLWRPRRRQLTPTFHYDILKDFVDVFNAQAQVMCNQLLPSADSGDEVDLYSPITLCALDIICETAMGRHVNAQETKDNVYINALFDITNVVHERQKKPWLWSTFAHNLIGQGSRERKALDTLHGFTNRVIVERYAQLKEVGGVQQLKEERGRLAFLDLLLDMVEAGTMPMTDVRPEVDTFMFEGHDTTATGMNWLCHLLGNHPECQKRIHAELDDVFGGSDRWPTIEELNQLKYLEACIKESLRLFPPVPAFARKATADVTICNYTVPCGSTVLIVPYMVHRDASQWPQPDHYKPERFLDPSIKRHSFAYIPFSAGSRNCIGQRFALLEMKTVMSWMLRYFEIDALEKRHEVRTKAELILRSTTGTRVLLKTRPLAEQRLQTMKREGEQRTDVAA